MAYPFQDYRIPHHLHTGIQASQLRLEDMQFNTPEAGQLARCDPFSLLHTYDLMIWLAFNACC